MTDRRDPIEAWLSADVDLMSPPPGTFERVHRRARHRKAVSSSRRSSAGWEPTLIPYQPKSGS
jgi:hypothetical protein